MSTTAAAKTQSVAAAEDIATPLATIAAIVRGMGVPQLQMMQRGAAFAHVPRVRVWRAVHARVMNITNETVGFASVSEVF
jgi:hypothetical protein